MARKKRAAPKVPIPWSVREIATLFGWLDYCISRGNSDNQKDYFWNTVEFQLADSGSNHCDIPKIKAKLQYDYWHCGAHGTKWNDIYVKGSSCFGHSQTEKVDIANAYRNFQEGNCTTITTSRCLRPKATSVRHPSRKQAGSRTTEQKPAYGGKGRNPNSSLKPPAVKREIGLVQPSLENEPPPRKRSRAAPTSILRNYNHSPSPFHRGTPLSGLRTSRSVTIVDDIVVEVLNSYEDIATSDPAKQIDGRSSLHGSPQSSSPGSAVVPPSDEPTTCISACYFKAQQLGYKPGEILCSSCKTWQHSRCVGFETQSDVRAESIQYVCDGCDPEASILRAESGQRAQETAEYKLRTAIHEIEILQQQLEEVQCERNELKKTVMELEEESDRQISAQARRDQLHGDSHGCRAFEGLLQEREKHIKKLEENLRSRRSLGTFTKLQPKCCESIGVKLGTDEGLSQVYIESKQFILQLERKEPLIEIPLDNHPELRSLIYESLQLDKDDSGQGEAMENISRLKIGEVLRALISSALHLWIFQTDFPQLDNGGENRSGTLLAQYRECLLQQDGPVPLRNLDLAAHHALINGQHFQDKTIPDEATRLAIKFSQTLAPLFSSTPESPTESTWDNFATWAQNEEQWRDRRSRLIGIFREALMLKALSCVNAEDYQMRTFRPNEKFDKRLMMDVETEEGLPDVVRNDEGRLIRLCVAPAIFSYPRKIMQADASVSEACLVSKNFVGRDEDLRRNGQLLLKAIVVLVE